MPCISNFSLRLKWLEFWSCQVPIFTPRTAAYRSTEYTGLEEWSTAVNETSYFISIARFLYTSTFAELLILLPE